MLKIYHNPRCSKSRQTLALLKTHGLEPEVVEYLKTPLSAEAIKLLQAKLGLDDIRVMMRRGEADYKDNGLKSETNQNALLAAMVNYPKLLERPIVETDAAARIGRPPESVLEILK